MAADTAAIVVIGDEILSGKFADENASYLIGALRELGVSLERIEVIPDRLDDIAESVGRASERYAHVFTSGGIGPTHDDLTMAGIAHAFGLRVVRHPELEQLLRAYYADRLEDRNLRMAEVPEGAVLVRADHASWPVTRVRNVYVLPGVPALFRRKFEAIRELFRARPFVIHRIYCQAEEGTLAGHLDAVVAAHPGVAVGSYPRFEAVDFKVLVTLEGKDSDEVRRAMEQLVASLPVGVVARVE